MLYFIALSCRKGVRKRRTSSMKGAEKNKRSPWVKSKEMPGPKKTKVEDLTKWKNLTLPPATKAFGSFLDAGLETCHKEISVIPRKRISLNLTAKLTKQKILNTKRKACCQEKVHLCRLMAETTVCFGSIQLRSPSYPLILAGSIYFPVHSLYWRSFWLRLRFPHSVMLKFFGKVANDHPEFNGLLCHESRSVVLLCVWVARHGHIDSRLN